MSELLGKPAFIGYVPIKHSDKIYWINDNQGVYSTQKRLIIVDQSQARTGTLPYNELLRVIDDFDVEVIESGWPKNTKTAFIKGHKLTNYMVNNFVGMVNPNNTSLYLISYFIGQNDHIAYNDKYCVGYHRSMKQLKVYDITEEGVLVSKEIHIQPSFAGDSIHLFGHKVYFVDSDTILEVDILTQTMTKISPNRISKHIADNMYHSVFNLAMVLIPDRLWLITKMNVFGFYNVQTKDRVLTTTLGSRAGHILKIQRNSASEFTLFTSTRKYTYDWTYNAKQTYNRLLRLAATNPVAHRFMINGATQKAIKHELFLDYDQNRAQNEIPRGDVSAHPPIEPDPAPVISNNIVPDLVSNNEPDNNIVTEPDLVPNHLVPNNLVPEPDLISNNLVPEPDLISNNEPVVSTKRARACSLDESEPFTLFDAIPSPNDPPFLPSIFAAHPAAEPAANEARVS
jgi:hypothetical protein